MMRDLAQVKDLLLKVKRTYGVSRAEHIGKLQDMIWDGSPGSNAEAEAMLAILASDLSFYETDERDRDENLGYFGDARLEEIIDAALLLVENLLNE